MLGWSNLSIHKISCDKSFFVRSSNLDLSMILIATFSIRKSNGHSNKSKLEIIPLVSRWTPNRTLEKLPVPSVPLI